MVHCIWGFV